MKRTTDFEIKLLMESGISLKTARTQIIEHAARFAARIVKKPTGPPGEPSLETSQRYANIAKDILDARFWAPLTMLDGTGYNHNTLDRCISIKDLVKKNDQARSWAMTHFDNAELNEILNIAVNQALLRPYETAHPGNKRGHSLLYEELVEKEDSMFSISITPEFHRRLNNGRFWEELPHIKVGINQGHGVNVVRDVLESHFEELDVSFAAYQGIELMRYSSDNQKLHHLDLEYLGEIALDRYAQFLSQLDEHNGIPTETIEELLTPYVSTILSWDTEQESPYYDGEKDCDDVQRGRFQDKLHAPIIQKYLGQSAAIREHTSGILTDGIGDINNENGEYSKFVKEVLDNVPNPEKIMISMLLRSQTKSSKRFFQESERYGHSLDNLMPER